MKVLAAAPLVLALLAPASASVESGAVSIAHICRAEQVAAPGKGPRKAVMTEGVGTGGFKVRTTSPEAQRWFDYGVQALLPYMPSRQGPVLAVRDVPRTKAADYLRLAPGIMLTNEGGDTKIDTGNLHAKAAADGKTLGGRLWSNGDQAERPVVLTRATR